MLAKEWALEPRLPGPNPSLSFTNHLEEVTFLGLSVVSWKMKTATVATSQDWYHDYRN